MRFIKTLSILFFLSLEFALGQGFPVVVGTNGFPVRVVNGQAITQENFTTNLKKKLDAGTTVSTGDVWVAFGTSITNGSTAGTGLPYTSKLAHLIGTSIVSQVIPKGFPGERSDQILARYDSVIHPLKIGGVFLEVGTNDAAQSIPLAQFATNVQAIVQKVRADGRQIVIATTPPATTTGNSDARRLLIHQYNTWLRLYCAQNNIRLADVHSRLMNVATGDAGSGLYADVVHPNHLGHHYMAEAFADAFLGLKPFYHTVTNVSVPNLLTNPLFLSNSGSWYENPGGTGTAAVYSQKAASGLLKYGSWWEMDFTATAGGTKDFCTAVTMASKGLVVGDTILVTAIMELEDVEGGYATGAIAAPSTNGLRFRIMNQSFTLLANVTPNVVKSPGPISFLYVIPSGTTQLILDMNVVLETGRHAKFRIGEVGMFKASGLPNISSLLTYP